MYEKSLQEAERILGSYAQVVIPAKELWDAVTRTGRAKGFDVPSFPDFTTMLEADKRFEFMPADKDLDDVESGIDDEDGEQVQMVQLGFFSEDRVKLKRIPLPRPLTDDEEEIGSITRRSIAGSSSPRKTTKSRPLKKPARPATRRKTPKGKRPSAPKRAPGRSGATSGKKKR